jgi:hypothetical protein
MAIVYTIVDEKEKKMRMEFLMSLSLLFILSSCLFIDYNFNYLSLLHCHCCWWCCQFHLISHFSLSWGCWELFIYSTAIALINQQRISIFYLSTTRWNWMSPKFAHSLLETCETCLCLCIPYVTFEKSRWNDECRFYGKLLMRFQSRNL